MRVAFQGERGAFSEEAITALLGARAVPLPQLEFADVAQALRSGAAERAVLPVENSIHGSVIPAWDVLATGEFRVLGATVRPIELCLAGLAGTQPEQLRRVLSHPVALGQCQHFLRQLTGCQVLATYDTAGAAREVAELGDTAVGAISSRTAAALHGLEVLRAGVQDRADNQTRFLLIGRAADADVACGSVVGRRRLLLLDLADTPGALASALSPFAAHGLNLCSIQPRPAGVPWTYRFFIEVEAGDAPDATEAALAEVRLRVSAVTTLGGYD